MNRRMFLKAAGYASLLSCMPLPEIKYKSESIMTEEHYKRFIKDKYFKDIIFENIGNSGWGNLYNELQSYKNYSK